MSNPLLADLPAEEAKLFEEAWPDGPHDDDVRVFRTLSPARRSKVAARLTAVLKIEATRKTNARAHVDMSALARDAKLSRDGLLNIRKKWDADRSISSLVPYLGRAEKQPTQLSDEDPIVLAARAIIADTPDALDGTIAGKLKAMFGVTKPRGIRLVRRLRRDDALDPNALNKTYGRAVVVDLCAIDRTIADAGDTTAVLCLVAERASSLIIGHAVVSGASDTLAVQRAAVLQAADWLEREVLDLAGAEAGVILTLANGPHIEDAVERIDRARAAGIDYGVTSLGPRRYGRRLLTIFGKRLGALSFRPLLTDPNGDRPAAGSMPSMTLADLAVLVAAEVAKHNEVVITQIRDAGFAEDSLVSRGAMSVALRHLAALLPS